jgi:hypothetical protein
MQSTVLQSSSSMKLRDADINYVIRKAEVKAGTHGSADKPERPGCHPVSQTTVAPL